MSEVALHQRGGYVSRSRPAGLHPQEIGASVLLHLLLFVALLLAGHSTRSPAPLIDPSKVMQVQAVALPKQTRRLPDKPMHTPEPVQGSRTAKAPPPPPTASDMVYETSEAQKTKGGDIHKNDEARRRLLDEMKRKALIRDLTSQVGPEDHTATDPDGVAPEDAVLGPPGSGHMNPELARYIAACRAAILRHWTPLPATVKAHPEYKVTLKVVIHPDGTKGDYKVVQGTGDDSFDRSAVMAVLKSTLPAPPAKYRDSAEDGVYITLFAKDER